MKKPSVPLSPAERRLDFRKWVDENLTVESSSGDEYVCVCPRCGREKLAVNVRRKAWQCWICGFSGWRPTIMMAAVMDCHPLEAEAQIAGSGVLGLSSNVKALKPKSVELTRKSLPIAPAPPGTTWKLSGHTKRYAHSRGISEDHAEWFGLSSINGDGSGSKADRLLSGRLLIPVWNQRKQFVYWVARATMPDGIKTLNLPDASKHIDWGLPHVADCAKRSDVLVGLHLVAAGSPVVIVEGPMDAVVCGPGFVATMGSSLSIAQAFLLASAGVTEATILFDPDEAGMKGAAKAHALLSSFIPTTIANCPAGTDPADLGRAAALRIVVEAKDGNGHSIAPLGHSKKISYYEGLRREENKVESIWHERRQSFSYKK